MVSVLEAYILQIDFVGISDLSENSQKFILWCICWAQSMDLRNPRIALHEAWIRAFHDDPWIVRSIRGLRNSQCAKYRYHQLACAYCG